MPSHLAGTPGAVLPYDRIFSFEGRQVRFTNILTDETRAFEAELCQQIELTLNQKHIYLRASRREFRLLQIRAADGRAAMQIAVYIHRPARLRGMGRAIVPKLAKAIHVDEEAWALRLLRRLCAECSDIITLRLQPLRHGSEELAAFEERARKLGYSSCDPVEYTRTLKYELTAPVTQLLEEMSKKTRAKVRHRTREELDLRVLTDSRYIPQCRAALAASFSRTGGDPNQFDFEAAFEIAATEPGHVRILGIFLPDRPEELLAYVIGFYGGGDMAVYMSAGSLSDPALRKTPFNYFLVWELVQWAHAEGARWLDLGGITTGEDGDTRATISEFKRHLSETEIELGRELLATLKPVRTLLFERLNDLRLARRKHSFKVACGLAASLLVFAVFSMGLKLAGNPASPPWAALKKAGHTPDIAIIGDSRAHAGISPTILTRELELLDLPALESYNFAVNGTDVLHHYSFATQGLLEGWTPPDVIIWAPNPLEFNSVRQNNRLEQLRTMDLPALYRAGAPMELLLDLATMSVFSPYRERPLVMRKIFEDYGGRAAIRTLPLQARLLGLQIEHPPLSREYHALPDGQEPFTVLDWADRFKRGADTYLQEYAGLKLSQWHFNLARDLMRRVRKAGGTLVIVELPVAPYFQKNLESLPVHQQWRARMQDLAREQGAIYLNHADHYKDDHLFGDPGHMPEATAADYSRFLATELAGNALVHRALESAGDP